MKLEDIIGEIIAREGGYSDHAADKGGPTKYGITLATLSSWRDKPQTADDVRALDESEARAIYRKRYVVDAGFADLPDPLRGLVVDCGVNHGLTRATRWLQRAVGVVEDGTVGAGTLRAVGESDAKVVYRRVLAQRVRHYGRIITVNPAQAVFAAGWANRAAEFVETAP